MASSDITLSTTNVEVTPGSYGKLDVELEEVEESEILNLIDIDTAIEHYGKAELLNKITKDEAIAHFGIEVKED